MPEKQNRLLRVRFYCNPDDPRPINWPVKFPYWVTGESETHSIVVSYADSENYIMKNWPDAENLDAEEVPAITFSDRFPKPDWYAAQQAYASDRDPGTQPSTVDEDRNRDVRGG